VWIEVLFWLTAAAWLGGSLYLARAALRLPTLGREKNDAALARVSIIVAARDEAGRIEETVRRLAAQRGVDTEVIAVDDRSTDGTGAILDALAQKRPNVRAEHVDARPDGWLGKCHACQVGAAHAGGDWLLFTDADTWMEPDVVARAIHETEQRGAAHLCLIPHFHKATFIGKGALMAFALALVKMAHRVNHDAAFGYIGIGAFNLIRRDVYNAIGGHEALRFEVVDDVKLGYLVRTAGLRSRCLHAGRDVEVEYAVDARSLLRLLSKNQFAVLHYRWGLALLALALHLALWSIGATGIPIGVVTGSIGAWAAGLAWLTIAIPAGIHARRHGWSAAVGILAPPMMLLGAASLVNSMIRTGVQGGVRWRETFYPLARLREGVVW